MWWLSALVVAVAASGCCFGAAAPSSGKACASAVCAVSAACLAPSWLWRGVLLCAAVSGERVEASAAAGVAGVCIIAVAVVVCAADAALGWRFGSEGDVVGGAAALPRPKQARKQAIAKGDREREKTVVWAVDLEFGLFSRLFFARSDFSETKGRSMRRCCLVLVRCARRVTCGGLSRAGLGAVFL